MPQTMTTDEPNPTRADIVEALTNMAATASRMPTHWADRKAAIHDQINHLLTELESLPA